MKINILRGNAHLLPEITVGVIDDDIFEEDEYFYVHLSNPRVVGYPEIGTAPLDASATPKAVLGDNHTATVTIYDDDHAGRNNAPMLNIKKKVLQKMF